MHDALSDSGWRQTMELEMKALHQNGMWELVPLPHAKKTVCRRSNGPARQ